jgi:hypothetical protein
MGKCDSAWLPQFVFRGQQKEKSSGKRIGLSSIDQNGITFKSRGY